MQTLQKICKKDLTKLILVVYYKYTSRSGGTGRRTRLKIWRPLGMWVRLPPSVPFDYLNSAQSVCFELFFYIALA